MSNVPWILWAGHVDPLGLASFIPGTPAEVRDGEVLVRARAFPGELCRVTIRALVRTRMINGWRVSQTRWETREWMAIAVPKPGRSGILTPRWHWRKV